MANDAYLKPGPLFPALPYSYYSSQHSVPGCCDSLPSLPGRYNPYTIPSATFPGTPRRPTPMSDLFSFNDIRSLQPPVPRTGVIDNAHHLTGVGNSEASPISAGYFDKSSSSSQFVPTISSTVCPPFGSAACGSFNRVEDLAGMPGTGTATSLLTGHNSYSPAPQDSAVNADTTSTTPLPSLVNSTSTTTTNTYPWSFYYQGLQMTTPNTKVFSGASHQSYSFDSPKVKLTSEVAVPLIEWFEEHRDHPYPSRQDKVTLCQMTGLTFTQLGFLKLVLLSSSLPSILLMGMKLLLIYWYYEYTMTLQVSTWFANARRRMKKHSLHDGSDMSLSPSELSNEEKSKSRRLSSSEECEVLSPE